MTLITKIINAMKFKHLPRVITTAQVKQWVIERSIVNDDGYLYAAASIDAILSNSDIANSFSTNSNMKMLSSRRIEHGKKEYWFDKDAVRPLVTKKKH